MDHERPASVALGALMSHRVEERTSMENVEFLGDEHLKQLLLDAQEVQKRNPPSSKAWQDASVVIHACVAENNRRYPKGS